MTAVLTSSVYRIRYLPDRLPRGSCTAEMPHKIPSRSLWVPGPKRWWPLVAGRRHGAPLRLKRPQTGSLCGTRTPPPVGACLTLPPNSPRQVWQGLHVAKAVFEGNALGIPIAQKGHHRAQQPGKKVVEVVLGGAKTTTTFPALLVLSAKKMSRRLFASCAKSSRGTPWCCMVL